MAGYGNRTAPDISPDSLKEHHASTRLGLTDAHDPPTYTGGAGLGNKLSQSSTSSSSSSSSSHDTSHTSPSTDDAPLKFDTQARHGSAPYSNAHVYGSASTAGAGWGNKTGSFGEVGEDSKMGKVLEKVGGVVHNRGLVEKGRGMREGDGVGGGEGMVAN